MELSRLKIKKFRIFSQKKAFLTFPEMPPSKNFLHSRKELSELVN